MNYADTIEAIREKKREHTNKHYWGNIDTLEPPYLEEEILTFEQHFGDKLPEDFRNYMIHVSKEVFYDFYPVIVNNFLPENNDPNTVLSNYDKKKYPNGKPIIQCQVCDDDFTKPCTLKPFGMPEELNYWLTFGFGKLKCPLCKNIYKGFCCNTSLSGGSVRIGNGGCANEDILIIKGPHKGTVWGLGDDGGTRIANSFTEYAKRSFWN